MKRNKNKIKNNLLIKKIIKIYKTKKYIYF